jgi:hypothetical protein
LSYAIIMPNMIKKWLKMYFKISNHLMIHVSNFNKIAFIDWSKVFIMPKHVFYDLSYAIIMPNMIKKWLKMYFKISNHLMIHVSNFNKIAFIDWSKMFIMPKHVFYDLSYAIIMSNMIKKWLKMYFRISNHLMIHVSNFNKIAFIDWSKMFIMPKHVFYDLSSMQL